MNSFLSVIFLMSLIILSCGKKENAWDELTTAEQEYIARQVELKCQTNSQKWVDNFTENSNEAILSNSLWSRGKYYQHKLKSSADSEPYAKNDIYIYKQDTSNNALYILVQNINSSGDSFWYFLRITPDANTDMIESMRDQLCTDANNIKFSGSDTGPMTLTKKSINPNISQDGNNIFYDDTYSFIFTYPAIFATEYKYSRKKKHINSDGDEVTAKAKTYESTFEATPSSTAKFVITPTVNSNRIDQNGNGVYTDSVDITNFYYCDYPTTFTLPIKIEATNCTVGSSGPPTGWDLSI